MKIGEIYKDKNSEDYIIIQGLPSGDFGKMETIIVNSKTNTCKLGFPVGEVLEEYLKDCILIN